MALRLITPASAQAVSLEECKKHARITSSDEDPVAEFYRLAAIQWLDGPDGRLNRALMLSTWQVTFDRFPCGSGSKAAITLPLTSTRRGSPLPTVVNSIAYVDGDGVTQTLAASAYRVLSDKEPNIVEPVYNTVWPTTRAQRAAVTITYQAGYDSLPADIKGAILNRFGTLYDNRNDHSAMAEIKPAPFIEAMLVNHVLRGAGIGD